MFIVLTPKMPPHDIESGLIMSVIRILSNSRDDAERDVIRKKLEDCLDVSDKKLTKLVMEHHKDLISVMQTFTRTADNLGSASMKLKHARQRLVESRERLNSKLDELKKLSAELETSERMVKLLDDLQNSANQESNQQLQQTSQSEHNQDDDINSTLMENNVFNPKVSENGGPCLFKFSRSSYAICFEDNYKELSI